MKNFKFRVLPVLAALALLQSSVGCIGSNSGEPLIQVTIVQKNSGNGAPVAPVTPVTPTSGSSSVYVVANASVTSSGVIARSNAATVFASIGEPGGNTVSETHGSGGCITSNEVGNCKISSPIQKNSNLSKVTGVGSYAFTGSSDSAM